MVDPFKIKDFSIGCLPYNIREVEEIQITSGKSYDKFIIPIEAFSAHGLEPESLPSENSFESEILTNLKSRYKRYEMISCFPVGILIRTIKERFFAAEVNALREWFKGHSYNDEPPMSARYSKVGYITSKNELNKVT